MGKPIILGGLVTSIVVHYGYAPEISNVIAGPSKICIDYMTNDKWITAQFANKFRWSIAKNVSFLLPNLIGLT